MSNPAFDQFTAVLGAMKAAADSGGERLVNDLAKASLRYEQSFATFALIEKRTAMGQLDREEAFGQIKAADLSRRTAHEALISQMNAVNRYLIRKPGTMFPRGILESTDRNVIGAWGRQVAQGLQR